MRTVHVMLTVLVQYALHAILTVQYALHVRYCPAFPHFPSGLFSSTLSILYLLYFTWFQRVYCCTVFYIVTFSPSPPSISYPTSCSLLSSVLSPLPVLLLLPFLPFQRAIYPIYPSRMTGSLSPAPAVLTAAYCIYLCMSILYITRPILNLS